jgi:Holliday junction resolvase RusA-like endonuclease
MKIVLPIKALSLNNCYRGRRFATDEKKKYDRTLQLILPSCFIKSEYYKVTFRFGLKWCFAGDLDNLCKVLLDNLVNRGIIKTDRKVVEIHLYKYPSENDSIQIEIEPAFVPDSSGNKAARRAP